MSTVLLVGFLGVHGLLHLAVWLPKTDDPERPQPFEPDHSSVLTAAGVEERTTHTLAIGLAAGAAATYVLAAIAVASNVSWAIAIAVSAALLGIALKVLYFHPWLSVGVLLDVLVLSAALVEWPVSLG
jgi:hypothetical protein